MKHIVSFSGGKDSTAMLLMMLERGWPVDDIVYFDCGDWEFPQMHKHINRWSGILGGELRDYKIRKGLIIGCFTMNGSQKGGKS